MWFKVDDQFHAHPKVKRLDMASRGLWVTMGAWCSMYLTDGTFTGRDVRDLKGTERQAEKLIATGLWERTDAPAESSESTEDTPFNDRRYRFHDWTDWQPTAQRVLADRESARRRQAKRRGKNSPTWNDEEMSHRDSHRESHDPGPTRPDPARPDQTELRGVVKGKGGSRSAPQRNGAAAPGMDRKDLCHRHAHIPPGEPVPPCHDCRDTRLANERHAQDSDHARHTQAQARREAIAQCLWCDEHGWELDPGTGDTLQPAVKCDHTQEHAFDSTG